MRRTRCCRPSARLSCARRGPRPASSSGWLAGWRVRAQRNGPCPVLRHLSRSEAIPGLTRCSRISLIVKIIQAGMWRFCRLRKRIFMGSSQFPHLVCMRVVLDCGVLRPRMDIACQGCGVRGSTSETSARRRPCCKWPSNGHPRADPPGRTAPNPGLGARSRRGRRLRSGASPTGPDSCQGRSLPRRSALIFPARGGEHGA